MTSKFIALDIETSGLDFQRDRIICVGFSDGHYFGNEPFILGLGNVEYDGTRIQKHINKLKQAGYTLVFQNGSFDVKFLRRWGVTVENEFDTMIAAYLLTDKPGKLSLDSLASYYLGIVSWKQDFKSGDALRDPELMKLYCLTDCKHTEALAYKLEEKLKEEGKLDFFYKLMKARQMLTRAEYTGVKLNVEATRELIAKLSAEYEQQLTVLNSFDLPQTFDKKGKPKVFNWSSPAQVKSLLKDQLGLNVLHPLTKKESADIEVLEMNKDKHPLIPELIKMRGTKKLMGTLEGYIESLGSDGRLHPNFNCTNTITGRLSSSGALNIQQVDSSARVRSLFVAKPGHKLVIGDLAQIEPRLAAHYSKDPVLMEMFKKEEDLYGTIACQILGADCAPNEVKDRYPDKRKIAKVIGLSVLYGIGVNKLAGTIRNDGGVRDFSIHDARNVIDTYFTKFRGLKDLQMRVHRAITSKGHLENLEGRKVDVDESKVHRDGVNSLLQSSASDFMLFKTVEAEETFTKKYEAKLLVLCHDESIFEVPEHLAADFAQALKEHMQVAPNLRIPIKFECSVGDSWADKG